MKPSALFAAAVLAVLSFPHEAAACSPNLANYGNCVRQQQEAQRMMQYQMHQQQQQQYGGGSYAAPSVTRVVNTIEKTIYYAPVVIGLFKADGWPYFYRTVFESPYNEIMTRDWRRMEEEALEECNRKSGRAPCKLANLGVSNDGCIVMVETDYKIYGDSDISGKNACGLAEQKAMKRCKSTDPKPKQCKLMHRETGR